MLVEEHCHHEGLSFQDFLVAYQSLLLPHALMHGQRLRFAVAAVDTAVGAGSDAAAAFLAAVAGLLQAGLTMCHRLSCYYRHQHHYAAQQTLRPH